MQIFTSDTNVQYIVEIRNAGTEDLIEKEEAINFPETQAFDNNSNFRVMTQQQADELMEKWAKKCSDKNTTLPKDAELFCYANIQAEGMESPIWVVVMPKL